MMNSQQEQQLEHKLNIKLPNVVYPDNFLECHWYQSTEEVFQRLENDPSAESKKNRTNASKHVVANVAQCESDEICEKCDPGGDIHPSLYLQRKAEKEKDKEKEKEKEAFRKFDPFVSAMYPGRPSTTVTHVPPYEPSSTSSATTEEDETSILPSAKPLRSLVFKAEDALALVGPADPHLSVQAAETWKRHKSRPDVMQLENPSDWTFTSPYQGTLTGFHDSVQEEHPTTDESLDRLPSVDVASIGHDPLTIHPSSLLEINMQLCKRTDIPILFYSEVMLYEDELDDHGAVQASIRVRVMESFVLILYRFFLRIDHVMVRLCETRYYHEFGSNIVVEEVQRRESPYENILRRVGVEFMTDPDRLQPYVKLQSKTLKNWKVPACPDT